MLYLIRGIPGSGKTTLANTLASGLVGSPGITGVTVVAADDFMVDREGNYDFRPERLHYCHTQCLKTTEAALKLGEAVIVHNTLTTEKELEPYIRLAKELDVRYTVIIVENRHEGKNVHGVPDEKLQQMRNRFSLKL